MRSRGLYILHGVLTDDKHVFTRGETRFDARGEFGTRRQVWLLRASEVRQGLFPPVQCALGRE